MNNKLLTSLFVATSLTVCAQQAPVEWNTPGAGNPFIHGYFADPTIRKFGDTFYIYATTDGTGNGYGPAQVWMSKDFVHWRNQVMNWPTTTVVWAPDVIQTKEGKYRYYYCTPCQVYVGESDTPVGPWTNMLGRPDEVLMYDRFCHPRAITLDPQVFTDDNGSQYMFVGTWGFYDDSGCGWAKLAADGKSFTDKGLISSHELKDFFEAPFLFKRNGIYYFTYSAGSCHDDTYRVQYSTSTTGPTGPYTYKGCILKTNADGTVHGPGHHSILVDGDDYYIVYHRHNNPHSIHGFNRQLCIDKLEFDENGDIKAIVPTHSGLLPSSLAKKAKKYNFTNLAYQAKVTASSVLSDDFKAEYAVDDNNGTLWRPANNQGEAWLQIDLGKETAFNQIWLQFEYATFFYQYKVETSNDGKTWEMYSDKTNNTDAGSPMIEKKEVKARYVKVTITDTQKNGHFGALWNVKIYNATKKHDPSTLLPVIENMDYEAVNKGYPNLHKKDVNPDERVKYNNGLVVDINADDYAQGKAIMTKDVKNRAGAAFKSEQGVLVEVVDHKYAFYFDGSNSLTSTFDCPKNFTYNSAFTISAWILNPSVDAVECIACVTPQSGDLTSLIFNQGRDRSTGLVDHSGSFESTGFPEQMTKGEGQWQHWTITYDGWMERYYLNGELVGEKNNFLLFSPEGPITIGMTPYGSNGYSGYIHSLKLYDRGLSAEEVKVDYSAKSDTQDKTAFDTENLKISTEVVAPSLVRLSVTDKEGNPVNSGQLKYSFGVTSDKKQKTVMSKAVGSSSIIISTDGKKNQTCQVIISNSDGTSSTLTQDITVSNNDYTVFTDDFKTLKGWDGKYQTNDKVSYKAENGVLTLTSSDTNFDQDPSHNGAMMYKEVKGDFILQAKIHGMTGAERRSTPGYNEGGLMVILPKDGSQEIVQLGVFPNYDCGNMLTVVGRRGRPQYQNRMAWNYDPYMQLQRVGDLIYARTSKDGKTWTEMPASPVDIRHYGDRALQVGLFQTTYSANSAWVSFSDFKLWLKK